MILQAVVLSVLLCCVHSFSIEVVFKNNAKYYTDYAIEDDDVSKLLEKDNVNVDYAIEDDDDDDDDVSISTLLEKANVNVGKNLNEPLVLFGDIAVPTNLRNADPCTARGCLWPKSPDGNVYVPFRISNQFSRRERDFIIQSLESFAQSTCIRFTPLDGQRDFVDIQSLSGCFSFVGRRGRAQTVSISRQGCVFLSTIQHEMLHALGFNHEQTRSDRDENVRILLENVIPGMEHNFMKIQTRNLGTPYDYNSVMHYGRFAFSSNRQPTIIPIPDPNVAIGRANQMSPIDILRVNRLYQCNSTASRLFRVPVRRYQFI